MTIARQTDTVDTSRAITGWLLRALLGTIFIGVILFAAAGQLAWLNGWVYLGVYLVVSVVTALVTDPGLLIERSRPSRAKARGQKGWDVVVLGLYGLLTTLLVPLVAGLNFRFAWPPDLAVWLEMTALAVYALGWGLHLWAMAANRYFALAVRIQHDRGQTVVAAGPYGVVRHPGYVGGILISLAAPLVLGSAWAMIPGGLSALVLFVRTILEDRTLQRELDGYQAYAQRVHYRLLPGVW